MKKYLLIGLTALALYACSDSSQNVVPVSQTKPVQSNQRTTGGEDENEPLDEAEILSTRYEEDLSDYDREIYELNPELQGLIRTKKTRLILGFEGFDKEIVMGSNFKEGSIEFKVCECCTKCESKGFIAGSADFNKCMFGCVNGDNPIVVQIEQMPTKIPPTYIDACAYVGNKVIDPPIITTLLRACAKYDN